MLPVCLCLEVHVGVKSCLQLSVLISRRARYMPPLAIGVVSLCKGVAWCTFTGLHGDFYMFVSVAIVHLGHILSEFQLLYPHIY
jgi:hypothetical protein